MLKQKNFVVFFRKVLTVQFVAANLESTTICTNIITYVHIWKVGDLFGWSVKGTSLTGND
ncbi:hypothetical protein CHI09_09765 [Shouchella clausii]|nr:hypothetical protein CHI09_09765 [Shouchella clausii]